MHTRTFTHLLFLLRRFSIAVPILMQIVYFDEAFGAHVTYAKPSHQPLRIVTFGTSLTLRGGWQVSLSQALTACLSTKVEIDTVAKAGANSVWGLRSVDRVLLLMPDIVVVEFAMNDASILSGVALRRSRLNIVAIARALKAQNPEVRVIIMSMNPALGLKGWVRPSLDAYYEVLGEDAALLGVEFVDLAPVWRAMPDEALAKAIPDGLHPLSDAATSVIVPRLAAQIGGPACAD